MTYTITNSTGLASLFRDANTYSNDAFGTGLLLSLYLIFVINLKLKGEDLPDAMIAGGIVTSLVALFCFFLEIVTGWHLVVSVLSFALPAVWSYVNKKG